MCVVSMVGDHYADRWQRYVLPPSPLNPFPSVTQIEVPVSRAEFEALKREVEDMKALLKRAKKYDEETGQPDCEVDDKVALLKRVAEAVGVDLSEVFGDAKPLPE